MISMKGGSHIKHMPRDARVFFLLAGVMIFCGGAARAEDYRVRELSFSGAHDIRAGVLKKAMETRAPSRFAWLPLVKRPTFDSNVFEDDLESIRNYYANQGYYHVRIEPARETDERKRTVRLRIHVDEGSPTRVNEVNIESPGYEPPEKLSKSLLLVRGEVFRIAAYNESKKRIETFMSDNGYGNAAVTGKAVVNKKTHTADITFTIETGAYQTFGTVFLSGNETIRDSDIFAELAFREGDMFSQARVNEAQRQIFRTDLFSSVIVEAERSEESEQVPVSIEVEEREKHTALLGLGYGSEDRFRVNAQWSKRYLFDSIRTLNLTVKYSSLQRVAAASLTQPYFIDRLSDLGVHAGFQRDYLPSYSNELVSTRVRVGRDLAENLEAYTAYNLELNRPVSVDESLLQRLLETRTGDYYFISGILFGIQYDTVKNKLAPDGGATYSLFLEPATFLLGSRLDYLRGIAEARVFHRILPGYIGAVRCRAGFIEPSRFTRDIPVFKRFFSGGGNTVRGYSFQSLGPVDAEGNALGGRYLFESNVEIRYPLYKDLGGVVFLDGGNVFLSKMDFTNFDIQYGAGAGLRYDTLIGPLRLDLAFPLDPFPELAVSRYAVYFSLGNAF